MATVILDTGILDNKLNVGQAEGTRTSMPLETPVYPSATNEMALISVQAGMMMVVTAYGALVESEGDSTTVADVYKVLMAEPVATRTVNTCHIEVQRSEVSIMAQARICDMTMTRCAPMVVIDVPGVYRVAVLEQDVTVTAMAHPIKNKA